MQWKTTTDTHGLRRMPREQIASLGICTVHLVNASVLSIGVYPCSSVVYLHCSYAQPRWTRLNGARWPLRLLRTSGAGDWVHSVSGEAVAALLFEPIGRGFFGFQVMFFPNRKTTFEFHHRMAPAGELNARVGGEMALL